MNTQPGKGTASFPTFAQKITVMAVVSTAATALAIMVCGQMEVGNTVQPLNAISHILWGDEAATMKSRSVKYTVTGLLLHTAAMTMWSVFYELGFGRLVRGRSGIAVLAGIVASTIAYVTDYYVVPARLAPGFERVLSNRCLFVVFAVLGASLAVGYLTSGSRIDRPSR